MTLSLSCARIILSMLKQTSKCDCIVLHNTLLASSDSIIVLQPVWCIDSMKPIKCPPSLTRYPTNLCFSCIVLRTIYLLGIRGPLDTEIIHIAVYFALGLHIIGILCSVGTFVS